MRRRSAWMGSALLAAALAAFGPLACAPAAPEGPWRTDLAAAMKEAKDGGKLLLIDFYSPG